MAVYNVGASVGKGSVKVGGALVKVAIWGFKKTGEFGEGVLDGGSAEWDVQSAGCVALGLRIDAEQAVARAQLAADRAARAAALAAPAPAPVAQTGKGKMAAA